MKCTATNRIGKPCGHPAIRGDVYCQVHSVKRLNIVTAMDDRRYFGKFFGDESWAHWKIFLKAIYRLGMEDKDRAFFNHCTHLAALPELPAEIYVTSGRQSGKTTAVSYVAAWEAGFAGHESRLAPEEPFYIVICAPTVDQAAITFNRCRQLLRPFKGLIVRDRDNELALANGGRIVVKAANDNLRGWSPIVLAICDEAEFFPGDNVKDVLQALTPSIITEGRLLCISSQNGHKGYVQDLRSRYFGHADDAILCWLSGTADMNPTYSAKKIARELKKDPTMRKEFYPSLTDDEAALFPDRTVRKAATEPVPSPPEESRRYTAYIDMSSGLADSAAMAIVSPMNEVVRVDVLMAADPPFDFVTLCQEWASTLRKYKCEYSVFADRYAYSQLESVMKRHGVYIDKARGAASDFYLRLRRLLEEGCVALLDDAQMLDELSRLEIKKTATGRVTVIHPSNFHDDRANAVAGAIYHLIQEREERQPTPGVIVQRKTHPIPEQEKARHEYEEVLDNEAIMQAWFRQTMDGVCVPLVHGAEATMVEVTKRKIGRPSLDGKSRQERPQ